MSRLLPVTLGLLALPLVALALPLDDQTGAHGVVSRALALALLVAVAGVAVLGCPRPATQPDRRAGVALWGLLLLGMGVELASLPAGLSAGMAYFTFGDHRLFRSVDILVFLALPVFLVLGVLVEHGLRGRLYPAWSDRAPPAVAAAIPCLIGIALGLPFLESALGFGARDFLQAELVLLTCHELILLAVWRHSGRALPGGLYRGFLLFVGAFVVNDVQSDHYTLGFYSANAGSGFYLMRQLCGLGALALVCGGVAVLGRARACPPESKGPSSDHA